jgi:hypothetical protein
MAKLGARHDELTASAAGHWFHAAEYRSGSIIDDYLGSPDMAEGTYGRDNRLWIERLLVLRDRASDRRVISVQQLH